MSTDATSSDGNNQRGVPIEVGTRRDGSDLGVDTDSVPPVIRQWSCETYDRYLQLGCGDLSEYLHHEDIVTSHCTPF